MRHWSANSLLNSNKYNRSSRVVHLISYSSTLSLEVRIPRGVELLNHRYTMGETTLNLLAYVDDFCLLCEDKAKLTLVLERVHISQNRPSSPSILPSVGFLTMVNHNAKKYVDPYEPILGSNAITALKWEDIYLGCGLGANPKVVLEESKRLFLEESMAVCQWLLTDLQKIELMMVCRAQSVILWLHCQDNFLRGLCMGA